MSLETPVVLLIFNRPKPTRAVFDAIARARPRRLMIVADGPRPDRPGDAEAVAATRDVVARVPWPCHVDRHYVDRNLGCKRCVAGGLEWVFEQTEEAIFLEDDCLPDPTFFTYCERLLERYRDDQRVAAISGDNFQAGQSRTPYSYYFSKYFHCWGWASWRRVWHSFDLELKSWPGWRQLGGLHAVGESPAERAYWKSVFDRQYAGSIDSWAYAWLYSCWAQSGLTILPNVNLVSNIGFDDDATHTRGPQHPLADLPRGSLTHLRHPPLVVRHATADEFTFEHLYHRPRGIRRLLRKLRPAA